MTHTTDALIVGAGPCGLFQVFELGLLDISSHVVDALPHPGGQCTELYPDKPIYDIPAYPVIGAQELVDKLLEQIKPFAPTFHFGQEVSQVQRTEDGTFSVRTSAGEHFLARTVIIAGGLGSFRPRKLRFSEAEPLVDQQVHYRVRDPSVFVEKDVVILGGGDSALDWTLELADRANSLTLVHRREEFRGAPASVAKMRALCSEGAMECLHGQASALEITDGQLEAVEIAMGDGQSRTLNLDHLLVFWGLHPNLGPIADWGLDIQKKQIEVDTEKFQTSEPGIFAIGDINTYPGKKKLILSGFHEAALAAFAIRQYLFPEKKVYLQYTTTSPKMHERLGVKGTI